MKHEDYMQRCLDLAQLGSSWVAPNPMVGCVIVKNGKIIGEGYHQRFGEAHAEVNAIESILKKQVNIANIYFTENTVADTIVVAIEQEKFFIESEREIDVVALKENLVKDLAYQNGFLESVMKKLGNERFVANAKPEVIAAEEKKKADAEARIKTIEESLANL